METTLKLCGYYADQHYILSYIIHIKLENNFSFCRILLVTTVSFPAKHLKPFEPRENNVLNILQAWISFNNFARTESLFYLVLDLRLQ
jgi:hypothetical protein